VVGELLHPAQARELGEAGRDYVLEKFGFDAARSTLRRALDLAG
jgi:hypothetical protein